MKYIRDGKEIEIDDDEIETTELEEEMLEDTVDLSEIKEKLEDTIIKEGGLFNEQ